MDMVRYTLTSLLLLTTSLLCSCATQQPAGSHSATGNPQNASSDADTKSPTGKGTNAVAFVRLFEDRSAEGDSTCVIDIPTQPFYLRQQFKNDDGGIDCKNDHAKSAKLENLNPGTTILLYSGPGCGTDKDWSEITVLKRASFVVWEFNMDVDESHGYYSLHSHDGTNDRRDVGQGGVGGNVSCMIIDMPNSNGKRAVPPHNT